MSPLVLIECNDVVLNEVGEFLLEFSFELRVTKSGVVVDGRGRGSVLVLVHFFLLVLNMFFPVNSMVVQLGELQFVYQPLFGYHFVYDHQETEHFPHHPDGQSFKAVVVEVQRVFKYKHRYYECYI